MKVSNCSLVRWFSSRGMCNLCSSGQELKHSEVLHHCELMAETCAASLPCSWHEALQKHPTETQSDKLSWPIAQREGPMRVRFSSTSSSHDLTPVLHHLAVLIQSVWASCTWCGQLRVMQWVKTFSENTFPASALALPSFGLALWGLLMQEIQRFNCCPGAVPSVGELCFPVSWSDVFTNEKASTWLSTVNLWHSVERGIINIIGICRFAMTYWRMLF